MSSRWPNRLRSARPGHVTMLAALIALSAALGGCQMIGYVLGLSGERVPPAYELADRPTLVMVEDPSDALGDPALAGVIARTVEYHLQDNRVLRKTEPIDQSELRAIANELDHEYAQTPIDRIGRLTGAEQVIHVTVRSVSMNRAPGVFEPTLELEVKVIDAVESRRLFPPVGSFDAEGEPSPGHRLTATLQRSMSDRSDQGLQATLARQLTEQAGRDVARLFHEWRRETGEGNRPR